jgi:multidrug resistance efflux pump
MLRNEGITVPAAILVSCSLLLAGCADERVSPDPVDTGAPEVRRGEFHNTILLTGELEAVSGEPLVVPRTPSWRVPIRWILDDGTEVREGDKVVELDTTEILGNLDQVRIAEIAAINEIDQKEADLQVRTAEKKMQVERARIALGKADLNAGIPLEIRSRREHQEAQLNLEKARVALEKALEELKAHEIASRAELDNLRIKLDKARRDIKAAEEAIENMTLRAPGDGIFIVSENWQEGRKWQVGDSPWVGLKLAEIPDLTSMQVNARLIDVDDGRIAPGLAAVCTMDTYPEMPIRGRIQEIGVVAKERDWFSMLRFFPVIVELERSDPEIMRPGMSVRVEVEAVRIADVLVAPRAAILMEEGTEALLLDDGSRREVLLGPCNARECVVEEGATEGLRLKVRG